jgi:acetyltransferase-like isoleucine patch superfamily enzyme
MAAKARGGRWTDGVKRGALARVRKELRPFILELYRRYLNSFWGMDIQKGCMISLTAKLDKTYPRGLHIGEYSAVNFGAVILTHDSARHLHVDTRIGSHCQIGAHSIIMPGVTIGDESIVSIASVVVRDVPPNTIVAGNPARAIEKGIRTERWGIIARIPHESQSNPEKTGEGEK